MFRGKVYEAIVGRGESRCMCAVPVFGPSEDADVVYVANNKGAVGEAVADRINEVGVVE